MGVRPLLAACFISTLALIACDNPKPAPGATGSPSAKPPGTAKAPVAAPKAAAPKAATPTASAGAETAEVIAAVVTDTLETSAGSVTLTPIHHGTVAFGFDGKTLLVDPYSEAPPGTLPEADLVLITHDHPDHFDPPAIERVRKPSTQFIAPAAVASKLRGARPLANGQETVAFGVRIRAVPAYNLKRGPAPGKLYHNKGAGNGYVLSFGDKRVYVSGDTECTPEMKALEDIDLALVCMNLPYTMPPEEAQACINAFKPKVLIPYHYRGSDLGSLEPALSGTSIEYRRRNFYLAGEAKAK